uniref:carbohydrate binding domain-containing protein n=1 Tax=Prevotella sp. TaxID=59823 RepID=UPI004026FD3B
MEWKLYHKDGTPLRDTNGKEISVHSLTYDGEWMGECSVSVSIENEAPVDFSIGDYLIYRNERFELNYDPGKAKQGRKNALGDSFKYSDIKLNSLSDELARAEFLDVVLNDEAQLHYTALPDFVFYIGSLDDLLDRLQANMNEQFGDKAWKFYSRNWKRSQTRGCEAARWEEIYGGDTTKEDTGVADTEIDSTSISVQNQTVWEGLALVNSQFDVNFITRNREVFVDTSGLLMQNTFKYGAAFGLVEINQDAESDQKIVTRMRAYGSEKNLPNRYYATLNMEVWADFADTIQLLDHTAWYAADIKLGGLNVEKASAYFTNHISDGQGSSRYSVSLHDGGVVVKATVTVLRAPYFEERIEVRVAGGTDEENSVADARKYYEAVKSTKMIHFVSGVNKEAFPDNRKDYATDHLPNNMACSRLMLPGFPQMSLQDWWNSHTDKHASLNPTGAELRFSTRTDRPWVESATADIIGVRPGSVFFDTEDIKEKKEEIFPTIKEMEVDGVRIDEIAVGTNVEDNGVFKDGQDVPSCKVELNEKVNFDTNALKQSDFSITMTDGMCAGRKFKVSGSVKENGRWVLTLQRVEDIGLYFPYKDFQISKGDHFVLSGIELPVQYVEAASEKLLRYAIAWLIENDHTRHTYAPKIYDIFMARQHDEAMADTSGAVKSIHDTIKEGDIMPFKDEDLGLDAEIIIDRLTIKEENGKIPSYEVSLREDKEAGTLQKMQEQITALGRGSGGGTTPAQVKEYIASEGSKFFLSKTKQDVAQKLIRFWEGIAFGEQSDSNVLGVSSDGIATLKEVVSAAFRSGALGSGFKLGNYSDSEDSYLEVDHLLVRKAAEFVKLVIRELQSVGGEIVLSPASMKISKVDFLKKGTLLPEYGTAPLRYDVYRCSFLTKRGDEEITNPFAVNDLVRCQTFNIKEGTTANAKNKYYWRRVTAVGTDYIDILALSGGNYGDSQPEVGDELVQMGNTTDAARQSVLYLSAYGSDSPSIKLYKGVNDYTLDGKEIFVVSRDEIYALASMFKLKVKDGSTTKETTLAELVLNVDGLTSTVAANKQEVDRQIGKINTTLTQNAESITSLAQKQTNTENKVSKIEQTTDKISLQVETTTNLKNSIVGSALRPWDDITKIAAAHSQKVEITSGGGVGGSNYATFSASGATADTYTGLYFKDVRVSAGKTYVFSVWAKLVSLFDNGAYYSIKRFDGGTEGAVVKSGNIYLSIGGWKLFTATFTVPDGCTKLLLELAVRRNGAIDVCRPMIMEGTEYGGWSLSPYDKTEAGKLESGLKRAGIDLEDDTITATANKFMVKNNSGEVTASVNENGVLEVGAGLFGGFVKKNLTVITPDNIGQYTIPSAQLGYVVFDFATAGPFVRFEGDFKAVYGDSYPVIILPYNNYSTDTSSNSKPAWQVAPYLDQTFIVINRSNTSIRLIGGGTINKKGSTSLVGSTPANEVNKEQSAILKCTLVPTVASSTSLRQNSFKIVWDGYVFG